MKLHQFSGGGGTLFKEGPANLKLADRKMTEEIENMLLSDKWTLG